MSESEPNLKPISSYPPQEILVPFWHQKKKKLADLEQRNKRWARGHILSLYAKAIQVEYHQLNKYRIEMGGGFNNSISNRKQIYIQSIYVCIQILYIRFK